MVGLADSYLSDLGYIVVVQVTILPFVAAFWFHNRSLTGWAFPSAMIVWWEIAIRHGLGVNDPLGNPLYTPLDLQQAQYLYFVVFTTITVACAIMGTAVAWLLGFPYLLPMEAIWPETPGTSFSKPSINSGDYSSTLPNQDAAVPDDCGLTAFGFTQIPKQYFHFFITLILFVVTVALPFILFEWLYASTILGAFLCGLLIPIVGYIVAGLFWRYFTSLYVFGPNDNSMKNRDDEITLSRKLTDRTPNSIEPDLTDMSIRNMVYANTNYNIWKTVLIMGGLHVLTFLLVGGVASFTDPVDVDVVWILGICVILAIALIVALIVIIYYFVVKNRAGCTNTATSANIINDGGDLESGISLNNKSKITASFLNSHNQ